MADDVLYQGVCGITDLITNPGMINLDFADIKTVMGNMGKAMMGTGESSGDERAKKAAEAALSNPLLDNSNIKGAKSILLNIKGGPDMALFEVDEAATKIRNEVDENANIIFGSSISESLEGIIRVSVVATGIDSNINILKETGDINSQQEENLPNQSSVYQDKILNVEKTTMNPSEQIDLETQINERDNELKIKTEQFDLSSISANKNIEELGDIIDKRPNNNLTSNRPENILKRLSTFFKNENIDEIKVEPNFKNTSKINDEFSNEKGIHETKSDNVKNSNNLNELKNEDLFKPQKKETISEQQISLIGIEQNEEDIDQNVLEIPAFLRRQAN
jgi:cell division protein FtsZ